jgi:hypothetical protein
MHRHPQFFVAVAAVIIAAVLAMSQGEFIFLLIGGAALFFFIAPGAVITGFLGSLLPAWRARLIPIAIALTILAAGLITGLGIGWVLGGLEARNAMREAEALVPAIEAFRRENGRFPSAWSELPNPPTDPVARYVPTSDDSFSLTVNDRRVMMRFWVYLPKERRWAVED